VKSNKVVHHTGRDGNVFSDVETEIEALRTTAATVVSAAATFANDNRVLRSDGTSRGAQASPVICDDSGNVSGIGTLATTGTITQNSVAVATLNTNTFAQQQGFARASLTDASTITWNAQTQQSAYVLLTSSVGGTRVLGAPSNLVSGFTYILMVQQSSTGSNALTYNGVYKWPGGVAPVLSTANNAIDILTFISDGTNMYGVAQKSFS